MRTLLNTLTLDTMLVDTIVTTDWTLDCRVLR